MFGSVEGSQLNSGFALEMCALKTDKLLVSAMGLVVARAAGGSLVTSDS